MKTLLSYLTMGIFLISIIGCEKTQLQTGSAVPDTRVAPGTKMYMANFDNPSVVSAISIDDYRSDATVLNNIAFKNTNHSANGKLITSAANKQTLTVMQNPSGVHGETHIKGPFFNNIRFDSDCIFVAGIEAYWGGTITHWEVDSTLLPPGFPGIDVGWSIYFAAADSGQGSSAPPDAYGAAFFWAPPTDSLGAPIPPLCAEVYDAWQSFGIPFFPGEHPTNVKVK